MRFLQISVVILQFLINQKTARLIKFQSHLVQNMHVQVDTFSLRVLGQIFFKICHHLSTDSIFTVGFQHSKSKDIGMRLLFIVLYSYGVCSNDYIVVICKFRKFGIFIGYLHVQSCGIFNRESLKIQLPQQVDVLVIDFTQSDRQYFFVCFTHIDYINFIKLVSINTKIKQSISMLTASNIFRVVGRIIIVGMILTLCASRWFSPQAIVRLYASSYQHFRMLLYMKRVYSLPATKYMMDIFNQLVWIDLACEICMAILILMGRRMGGWMMAGWYLIKIVVCYSPYLFNTPRLPFTYRERFDIIRHFAIFSIALNLTQKDKPYPIIKQVSSSVPKDEQINQKQD